MRSGKPRSGSLYSAKRDACNRLGTLLPEISEETGPSPTPPKKREAKLHKLHQTAGIGTPAPPLAARSRLRLKPGMEPRFRNSSLRMNCRSQFGHEPLLREAGTPRPLRGRGGAAGHQEPKFRSCAAAGGLMEAEPGRQGRPAARTRAAHSGTGEQCGSLPGMEIGASRRGAGVTSPP